MLYSIPGLSRATHDAIEHTSAMIQDGTIMNADINADAAIAQPKLALTVQPEAQAAGHVIVEAIAPSSVGQGTWAWTGASRFLGGVFNNTSAANGDNVSYKVYLAKGTYTLVLVGTKANNQGIVDIDIDGVEVASFDKYSGTSLTDKTFTQSGIVVGTAGIKTLKYRLDEKNASSSGYQSDFSGIILYRTA
jgi:hypothetical protein